MLPAVRHYHHSTCSDAAARCALASLQAPHSAHSQNGEDILLLPTLLRLTRGRPGTFVELGALDGIQYSNTRILEACYGWRGLVRPDMAHTLFLSRESRIGSAHSRQCSPPLTSSTRHFTSEPNSLLTPHCSHRTADIVDMSRLLILTHHTLHQWSSLLTPHSENGPHSALFTPHLSPAYRGQPLQFCTAAAIGPHRDQTALRGKYSAVAAAHSFIVGAGPCARLGPPLLLVRGSCMYHGGCYLAFIQRFYPALVRTHPRLTYLLAY